MENQRQHLLFYDGQCGLCDKTVQWVLKRDKKGIFAFAPLQGKTAESFLAGLPPELKQLDSLILVENYRSSGKRIYVMSRAVWRICWLLGGACAIPGVLSFVPGWLFDWGYRYVARNRHRFFPQTECVLPDPKQKGRFLP